MKTASLAKLSTWASLMSIEARQYSVYFSEYHLEAAFSSILSNLEQLMHDDSCEKVSEALQALEAIPYRVLADDAKGRSPSLPAPLVRLLLFFGFTLKKWRLPIRGIDPAARAQKAVAGFVARNRQAFVRSEDYSDRWIRTTLFPRMARILERWLPDVTSDYWIGGRFGPGACMEGYSRCRRFIALERLYDSNDARDPDALWQSAPMTGGRSVRLCAVPKTWDKDRLITVEPWVQGFLQQGVRSIILESVHTGPLRWTCMDLGYVDGQQIQRRLAKAASSDSRLNCLATLDLKDASDNISIDDVIACFPAWVVRLLEGCRTPAIRLQDESLGTEPLGIYAGMGNATTFVVETLFFSALIEAVTQLDSSLRHTCIKPYSRHCFSSVFGDDIICDRRIYEAMATIAPLRCFVVNSNKSFARGWLRESCGIYAYNGVDVTFPRIHGYSSTWSGRVALAEKLRQLLDDAQFHDLGARALQRAIGAGCVSLDEHQIYGYPSVGLAQLCPFTRRNDRVVECYTHVGSALSMPLTVRHTRINRDTQALETRVSVEEPRVRRFSHLSSTDGVSPNVWLLKWFTGERSESTWRGAPCDAFPIGTHRRVNRWLTIGQPPRGLCASADFSLSRCAGPVVS